LFSIPEEFDYPGGGEGNLASDPRRVGLDPDVFDLLSRLNLQDQGAELEKFEGSPAVAGLGETELKVSPNPFSPILAPNITISFGIVEDGGSFTVRLVDPLGRSKTSGSRPTRLGSDAKLPSPPPG